MSKRLADSIVVDKSLDLILMFLGLYAAMAVQDFVDHRKDRSHFHELLSGFQEELKSNQSQRQTIEAKLGEIDELKEIGEAGASFSYFSAQTQYMEKFLGCYTQLRLKGTKGAKPISDEELKECKAILRAGFKQPPPEHLDLAPVYRREIWRLYIAGGVQLFREFEKPSNEARCELEGKATTRLAVCLGSIYSELEVIEAQVAAIQDLVNETYFHRQGILDAEFKRFKRQIALLGKRKDAEAAQMISESSAKLNDRLREGQQAVDISLTLMRFKIRQLKVTARDLDQRIQGVLSSLEREIQSGM